MPVTRAPFLAPLLYAATTESLIPWEWLSESRKSELFMSEEERAEMFLRAVNGDSLPVREWTRLCGAPLNNQALPISVDSPELVAWWRARTPLSNQASPISVEGIKLADVTVPLFDQPRQSLRAALEGIMHAPETAVPEIDKNAKAIVDGRVIHVTEVCDDGVMRDRVIAHSIGAALIFTLRLILDPDKSFRRRLRQCAFDKCGRFAFGALPATRGQPPHFYCSEGHRDAHRKQQNKERAAAKRAGISVEKYRKLRSKKIDQKKARQ